MSAADLEVLFDPGLARVLATAADDDHVALGVEAPRAQLEALNWLFGIKGVGGV